MNGVREDNPVHDLNPYELRHLGEHLAAAGNAADLERLLALDWRREAPVEEQSAPPPARRRLWSRRSREPAEPLPPRTVERCRNAWYEAKEAIGDPRGYRGDVQRAWQMAAQACAEAVHADNPAPADRELRCALLAASVNSIGSGLPGELLRALVERGTWSEAHALDYAGQRGAAERQPKLAALLPALSSETRAEVLPELLSERADEERPQVLQALAPFLDLDQIRAVRAELNDCSEGYARSQAATALVRRLVELGRVEEAFQMVTTEMAHEYVAAEALTELAAQLDEAHVRRAFEVARGWEPAGSLPIASIGRCEWLAAFGRVREALEMAKQLDLPYQQARLVAQLAPLLDRETRAEVLALIPTGGAMEDIRAKALLALADKAAADGDAEEATGMIDAAVATIGGEYEYSRKTAIEMVAPELCAVRPNAALSLAEGIKEPGVRIVALGAVGAHLTGALRERAKEDALAAVAVDLSDEALTALASFDPPSAFTIVRRRVAELGLYGQTRDLIVAVTPYLPSELLAEARDLLVNVDDERDRDDARDAIAGELVVCGDPSGFERLAAMDATDERRVVIADVARRVPDDLFDQTFELIKALSGHDLEDPVKAAAPRLSPEQQLALLDQVAANDYDWAYSKVLQALSPYLDSALIEHALELAISRRDEAWRAWALVAIVPRLDSDQLARIRERIPKLSQEYSFQSEAMASAVATRLAELGLAEEAFTLASSITRHAQWQLEALCGLARHLNGGPRRDRIEELAEAINDPAAHADALAALATLAEEPDRSRLFDRAVALVRATTEGESSGPDPVTLARLARHGGAELVDRALKAGQAISDYGRPDLIEKFGALGPAEAESASSLARGIDEPGQRAEAFAKLLDRTPDPSPELVGEALRAIAAGDFAIYRKTQLRTVLDALLEKGHEAVEAEWSRVLPLLAERSRSELMSDVCAVVRVVGFLGGVDALRATERAVQDVERWWP